jgi:hypothetical protein
MLLEANALIAIPYLYYVFFENNEILSKNVLWGLHRQSVVCIGVCKRVFSQFKISKFWYWLHIPYQALTSGKY